MNVSKAALTSPARLSGNVTCLNACHRPPPRFRAASSSASGTALMAPNSVNTKNGSTKCTRLTTTPGSWLSNCSGASPNPLSDRLIGPLFPSRISHA